MNVPPAGGLVVEGYMCHQQATGRCKDGAVDMKVRYGQIRRKGQDGSVLLEFALAAPLLFLFFFGVCNLARLFTFYEVGVSAAEAGTQYGALSPAHYGDFTGMQNAALANGANVSGLTATASQWCTCSAGGAHVSCPASCGNTGTSMTYLQVDVSIPVNATLTFPGAPANMTVQRSSIVRVQ